MYVVDMNNSIGGQTALETNNFNVTPIVPGLDINADQTKEEATQASFDSDDDIKKVKILSQEQFLHLAQGPGTESPGMFMLTEYLVK